MVKRFLKFLFGGGAQQVSGAVEQIGGVFAPNAEANAQRAHQYNGAALAQYAAEFHARTNRTGFDSLVDGLNRLARPIITLTVLGVIPAVMVWPADLAVAFAALALLPTGYWALVSIIIGFYYGGRMQIKAQDFEKSVASAVERAPRVIETMRQLRDHLTPGAAEDHDTPPPDPSQNPAVAEWRTASAA